LEHGKLRGALFGAPTSASGSSRRDRGLADPIGRAHVPQIATSCKPRRSTAQPSATRSEPTVAASNRRQFCTQCGSITHPKDKFCAYCGHQLS
ncbi:MAG: hypothetical protein AAFQ40_07510, partial [Cyanobacteria bacterium J06623_5]